MFRQKSRPSTGLTPRNSTANSDIADILAVSGSLPSTFTDGLPLPKLFVLDLDYTIWAAWMDTHVSMPIKAHEGGRYVKDATGEKFRLFDDVPNILAGLRALNVSVAIASRSHTPEICREMLKLLRCPSKPTDYTARPKTSSGKGDRLTKTTSETKDKSLSALSTMKAMDFFSNIQIYPRSKTVHFQAIHEVLNIAYEEMVFFDDEPGNRNVQHQLGVVIHLLDPSVGLSNDDVDKGVLAWRQKYKRDA